MTTLAYDKPRQLDIVNGLAISERTFPVIANDIIYAGAAVGMNSAGNVGPLTGSSGGRNFFVGFAVRQADNSTGAAGAVYVDVVQEGIVKLDVVGVDGIAKVGTYLVHATDDDTFGATTAGTSEPAGGDAIIGKVAQYIGADGFGQHAASTCLVHFIGHQRQPSGAKIVTTDPTP